MSGAHIYTVGPPFGASCYLVVSYIYRGVIGCAGWCCEYECVLAGDVMFMGTGLCFSVVRAGFDGCARGRLGCLTGVEVGCGAGVLYSVNECI